MSIKNPIKIGRMACKCGSTLVKINLMNLGKSQGVDHIDLYCAICDSFIEHMNVIPFEGDEGNDTD